MGNWLDIYHHFPHPFQSMGASLWGYHLRAWRYGLETQDLIDEYTERESWSPSQWDSWKGENLPILLYRAAKHVPHYRDLWDRRKRLGDRSSLEVLENWPILTKEEVRSAPRRFVADDYDIRKMYHEHTSGTIGKSLDLWWSKKTVRKWYALFEARCRLWHGVTRDDRWAILGGQLIVSAVKHRPPFWVWNGGLNQLYMSSYHLAPDLIPYYLEAIKDHHISYLWGYSSALYALAVEVLRLKRYDIKIKVALTNAEPLHAYQREAIAAAFQCPVRETYGMAEIVTAASECPAGTMHLWPEVGVIEVHRDEHQMAEDSSGNLVCTGLLNVDMPLIRYSTGDRGTLANEFQTCACGRRLPAMGSVEGRVDDLLYTLDGRKIGRLDPIFKSALPVVEAQVIQESLDTIVMRLVPAPEYTPQDGQTLINRLCARMGDVHVRLELLSEIPRESNGKFRAVISHVTNH